MNAYFRPTTNLCFSHRIPHIISLLISLHIWCCIMMNVLLSWIFHHFITINHSSTTRLYILITLRIKTFSKKKFKIHINIFTVWWIKLGCLSITKITSLLFNFLWNDWTNILISFSSQLVVKKGSLILNHFLEPWKVWHFPSINIFFIFSLVQLGLGTNLSSGTALTKYWPIFKPKTQNNNVKSDKLQIMCEIKIR